MIWLIWAPYGGSIAGTRKGNKAKMSALFPIVADLVNSHLSDFSELGQTIGEKEVIL